ncbi:MAG TPA: class I tRNA ligase family protein, partial [Candidatus Saccharimonadales bacterium]|nr:class I tRNA ligase family protein [Candidatus Saccharimonadales bacterium]
ARKKTVAALEAQELIRSKTPYEHVVGYDYKSGLPIEPLIKDQWFIKIQPLAQRAKKAIENGEVSFTPESGKRDLIRYFDQLRDWNLSRQIPWGIPIPAFQNVNDPQDWIYNESVDEKTIEIDGKIYRREEDTFDTWFSSGQWPFIVTDYLQKGKLSRFYPNSVMETAGDILFAWVARMIMMGLYVTDQVPFKHVYLNGLLLDEKGQKMSKSKGNVISPVETIAEYGSDALRLGIIANRSARQNQAFSTGRVVAGRNFCNKLWNIARFAENKLGEGFRKTVPEPKTLADHWIMRELSAAITDIGSQIENYRFAEASETMYHAIWDNVADWYVEASKQQNNPSMLAWVLDTSLKIAHPFAPFVTETIWQTLLWHNDMLITTKWPEKVAYDDIAAAEFGRLKHLIAEVRFVISELPGNQRYNLLYQNDSLIADNANLIKRLAKLKDVQAVDQARGLRLANSGREAWLDVSAKTISEHESNLEVRLAEAQALIKTLKARLLNENYIAKAPAELVAETKTQLEQKQALVERLIHELDVLK